MSETEYRRRLTSGEKSMVALNELRPPFAIQLAVEGHGDPSPDALYDALEQATAANPGCAVRLEEGRPEDYWVPGAAPTLTIVDAPDFAAQGTEQAPFLQWRLDAKTGPTCELVRVAGRNRTYLVFRALHGVMDGQGALLWAKDVMRALRGETPVGHLSTLDVQTLCEPERENRRPYPRHDALHPLGLGDPRAAPGHSWRRVVVDRPLQSDASGRIAVALAAQARQHAKEPGVVRLHLPADLRPYARKERSTGNLFGSLFVEVPPEASAEDVGLQIVRMLYEREGQRPAGLYGGGDTSGSMSAHRVKAYLDLHHLHRTGRYAFSATLSHLGKLDGLSLSGGGFTATSALFVPLVADACVVSLNGFDAHTEVAVGVSHRFNTAGQLDALAEVLKAALIVE